MSSKHHGQMTVSTIYSSRVLRTTPLAYYRLADGTGATSVKDSTNNVYNGTYSNVSWDGTQCTQNTITSKFNGTTSYANIYSAGFASAFNMDEFTILLWVKLSSAVWADGALRRAFMFLRDASNFVAIEKSITANQLKFSRTGNATAKSVTIGVSAITDWQCLAISASIAGGGILGAGELRAYQNGAQLGTTQTGNVASSGSGLTTTNAVIGANSTAAALPWSGYLAHVAVWNRPISTDILALMTA